MKGYNMLDINLECEFKNYCLKLEYLQNQLSKTYNLKEKNLLRNKIENIKKEIDKILDEYNKGNEHETSLYK